MWAWVALWCAGALYAFYRTRLLWPAVVAEAGVNVGAVVNYDWLGADIRPAGAVRVAYGVVVFALVIIAVVRVSAWTVRRLRPGHG